MPHTFRRYSHLTSWWVFFLSRSEMLVSIEFQCWFVSSEHSHNFRKFISVLWLDHLNVIKTVLNQSPMRNNGPMSWHWGKIYAQLKTMETTNRIELNRVLENGVKILDILHRQKWFRQIMVTFTKSKCSQMENSTKQFFWLSKRDSCKETPLHECNAIQLESMLD